MKTFSTVTGQEGVQARLHTQERRNRVKSTDGLVLCENIRVFRRETVL